MEEQRISYKKLRDYMEHVNPTKVIEGEEYGR